MYLDVHRRRLYVTDNELKDGVLFICYTVSYAVMIVVDVWFDIYIFVARSRLFIVNESFMNATRDMHITFRPRGPSVRPYYIFLYNAAFIA